MSDAEYEKTVPGPADRDAYGAATRGARPPGSGGSPAPGRATVALAFLAIALIPSCAPEAVSTSDFDMVAHLDSVAGHVDPGSDPFVSSAKLDGLRARVRESEGEERMEARFVLARETLRAGRLGEGLAMLEELRDEVERFETTPGAGPPPLLDAITSLLAAGSLRLARLENCVEGIGAVGCRVPVPAEGAHPREAGARAAVGYLEELLARRPGDLEARWLLNLGHVMLGSYPEGVDPDARIAPSVFRTEHDVGSFRDVAPALGLDDVGHVGGALMDDFDGDGRLDVMATSWQRNDPIHYHLNRGVEGFESRTGQAGLEGLWGGGNLVQADYDNDGDLDVFVLRGGWRPVGFANSLLQNRGDGTFHDVTSEAGLLTPILPAQTAAWADYDGDGLVDLLVGNESRDRDGHALQLFRNLGDGTFEDVASDLGIAVERWIKGVAWGDYDNDGRPDIYLSIFGSPNVLFSNRGPRGSDGWAFEERTEEAGVGEPIYSFPTWFFDYDNDGWLDLFVAGYRASAADVAAEYLGLPHDAELPRLYRNRGDGTFEDVTAATGMERILFSMGANFGDLDNDGWLDHYHGTGFPRLQDLVPNRMFRNAGGAAFQEVTGTEFGLIEKGHGIAFGDIDHDGDQDIFQALGGAYEGDVARNVLLENPGHGNRWTSLLLVGDRSNRSAIGARVAVRVETESGTRTIHRMVGNGSSFGGNPLRLDVGLGRALRIESVTVLWPATGIVDRVTGLDVDVAYRIREGSGSAQVIERRPFSLLDDG